MFATNIFLMMSALRLKDSMMGTVHLREFIALNWKKQQGTFAMIKDDKYFHQKNIWIKMAKPILVLLRIADSNHPHMDKLRIMVLMIDDNIRIFMLDLND